MLAKFRSVISSFDREPLRGRVEVDEAFVGGPRQGKRGRGAGGKVGVAGAAEVGATGWGRCRIGVIPDATGPSQPTAHGLAAPPGPSR
jgi:hypothetical protein